MKMQEISAIGLGVLLMGCAESRSFKPTSNAQESIEKGPPFARYDVRTGAGDFGMVRVEIRTQGIESEGSKTSPSHRIVFRIDLNNDSAKTVYMDPARSGLNLVINKKLSDERISPIVTTSAIEIPGHSQRNAALVFPLPPSVKPSDISAFEVTWALRLNSDDYTQATGFSRDSTNKDTYHAYDPFYSPYGSLGFYGGPHGSGSSLNLGVGFYGF